MRAWLIDIRSLEGELDIVRGKIVAKKREVKEIGDSLHNLENQLAEITAIPGTSSIIRYATEEKKARQLWAKRDALRSRLDRVHADLLPEDSKALTAEYARLVREAAIQTAFVRGLALSTYPEVRTLDLRGTAGERELRMVIIQRYKQGYRYSRHHPKLTKQKQTLETQKQNCHDALQSFRRERARLSSSIARMNRLVRSTIDSLGKTQLRATLELQGVAELRLVQNFERWRSGEMDSKGEDILSFLERRLRGHPVSKSYLVNDLASRGLDLMSFASNLGRQFVPNLEPSLVAQFLIFCRRFDPPCYELLTQHFLESTLSEHGLGEN